MTPSEMIECGELMERSFGTLTSVEQERMRELQARAKVELPHDDPSTPDIDEGDTELVRDWKRKERCRARAAELLEGLKRELPDVLALVLKGVVVLARR